MSKIISVIVAVACVLWVGFSHGAQPAVKEKRGQSTLDTRDGVPEAKLYEIFTEYVCSQWQKSSKDVSVSNFHVSGDKPIPPGDIAFRTYDKEKKKLEGYVRLMVMIMVDGRVENTVRLSGWVDVFNSVVCTRRDIKKGEVLKKGDVYLDRRNISHLASGIVTDMEKVVGLMSVHAIKENSVLREGMLHEAPVVGKGDKVMILAESDGVKVTVPGLVLESGSLGNTVKVQNTMSKKEIHARVLNNLTVTVEF